MKKWHSFWNVGTLSLKNEKLAHFWHVGKWARGHVHHAGTYGTYGMRFSKLDLDDSNQNRDVNKSIDNIEKSGFIINLLKDRISLLELEAATGGV